jgi:photosystem II stability/assembly factor-like uncharacterized protein
MHKGWAVFTTVLLVVLAMSSFTRAEEVGDAWTVRESPVGALLVAADFADDQVGWASGIRTIIKTTDGGRSWQAQVKAGDVEDYWFNNIVALSRDVAMASGYPYGRGGGGVLLRTEDGGKTWNPVAASADSRARYSSLVFRDDNRTGFVIAKISNGPASLLTTSDGGKSWEAVSTPRKVNKPWIATLSVISLPDDDTLIVAADQSLLRSRDNGRSWETLTMPESGHKLLMWMNFATSDRGWAQFMDGDAIFTEDGGRTWQASTAPGPVFFKTAELGFAVNGQAVYQTDDGGKTWSEPGTVASGIHTLTAVAFSDTRVFLLGGNENKSKAFVADKVLP